MHSLSTAPTHSHTANLGDVHRGSPQLYSPPCGRTLRRSGQRRYEVTASFLREGMSCTTRIFHCSHVQEQQILLHCAARPSPVVWHTAVHPRSTAGCVIATPKQLILLYYGCMRHSLLCLTGQVFCMGPCTYTMTGEVFCIGQCTATVPCRINQNTNVHTQHVTYMSHILYIMYKRLHCFRKGTGLQQLRDRVYVMGRHIMGVQKQ